jgi:hypothetical protein
MFCFSLQLLLEPFFAAINMYQVILEVHMKMHVGLHEKLPNPN